MHPIDLTKSQLLIWDLQKLQDALPKLNPADDAMKRVSFGLAQALQTPKTTDLGTLRLALNAASYITASYGKDVEPLLQLLKRINEELEHLEVSARLVQHERYNALLRDIESFYKLSMVQ
jgi:DNA repair ATPase RecN